MTSAIDHEVLELLADDPELLAVADAVAVAGKAPVAVRRRSLRSGVIATVAASALLVLALVAPWNHGHASIVDRARAAIGTAPVLHAVTRETF
jgi:hypothetical protein